MTSSTDEPCSPEMPPAVEALPPPPSTVKSLKKLFRGVCDPRKTPLFVSDDEVDHNYDLYLNEKTTSPASNLPTSQKEKVAATLSLTEEKITPPTTQYNVVTPRRVLFPSYSNGKLVEMDTPQSEAAGKETEKEYDGESPALSSPMEVTKSLGPDISKNSKAPKGGSWSRHVVLIAAANFLMLGIVVYFSNTVAGGEAINEIKSRISKFHGQILNTPAASDGIVQKQSKIEPVGETKESFEETSWLDTFYGEAEDKIQQTYDQTHLYLQETVGYILLDLGEKQNQILEAMYEYQESIQQATSSTANQLLGITKHYSELETIQNITVALEVFLQKFSGSNTWEQMGIDFSLARWKDESSSVSEYIEPIQKTLELVLAKANLEHVHETWLASLADHMPEMNGLDESIYEKLVDIGDTINVYYEESGLPQYVATVEQKLKETIGEENIAIMDEKWAEILDVLTDYYKNNSLKEYFQFESVSQPITPTAEEEQTMKAVIEEEEVDSTGATSTGDSCEEVEEESSESLESSTESEVDENSLTEESEVMPESTGSDSSIDETEISVEEDIEEDPLEEEEAASEAVESESREADQSNFDENEALIPEEDIDFVSSDSVIDETNAEMLSTEEGEEEHDDAETEEAVEDSEELKSELSVEEDSTEVLEESTRHGELTDEESSIDESASDESLGEEINEDEDSSIDPEIIDKQSSLGEEATEIEDIIVHVDMDESEEAVSEEDSEEETEEVVEDLTLEEKSVLSENEGEQLLEDDTEKEVEEEASFDGEVTNDMSTEEQLEDLGPNYIEEDAESEEEAINEESEFVEISVEEGIEQETDEDTTFHEVGEVLEEEIEIEISEDKVDGPVVEVDEASETPTSMEESTIIEDDTPTERTIMEDDTDVEATSTLKETDTEKDSSTEISIKTPPRDIAGFIRGIEEIIKRDGSSPSSPLPPPPSDISEMIKGIESMLKEANIPRPSKEIEGEDLPELKARKNWNTSSGWLPRRQRS